MSASWLRQSERSHPLVLRLMSWIAQGCGRRVARWLLYPISAYFLLFSRTARRASRQYLQRLFGVPPTWADVFRHYHCFAGVTLDRLYLLRGRHDLFEITSHGREHLRRYTANGKGCLLLGAHLGSFEVLRSSGTMLHQLQLRVLMYEENARKIGGLLGAINPDFAARVIPIGLPDTLLRVKESLDRGEVVGMLGDRMLSSDSGVECTFLGDRAYFPTGPMRLAGLLKAPVVLVFGLYRGGNRYEIHVEPFAENLSLGRYDKDKVHDWTQRYVDRLEYYCRLAPYNWFNFYDLWNLPSRNPVRAAA